MLKRTDLTPDQRFELFARFSRQQFELSPAGWITFKMRSPEGYNLAYGATGHFLIFHPDGRILKGFDPDFLERTSWEGQTLNTSGMRLREIRANP